MAQAKKAEKTKQIDGVPGARLSKWGGKSLNVHLPSGAKLVFDEDENGILLFLGTKDISDRVLDKKTGLPQAPGEVVYTIWHDGKRVVSMATSYAFTEMTLTPDKFYYIHLAALVKVKPDFNPMKDFEIVELGGENEIAACDESMTGSASIKLTLETIRVLNYEKLNYPLRKSVLPKKQA